MQTPAPSTEQLLIQVLLQLIVMIAAARIAGGLFRRMGQPAAVGEIVAGLLLGPSLFGYFLPGVSAALFTAGSAGPIKIIAQIGLILLMFQIGCGFEFGRLNEPRLKRLMLGIAIASLAVPFGLGYAIGQFSAATLAPDIDRVSYSLFCGVALAITAVPILGRILIERGLARSDLGVVAISAAALNDVVGWIALAGVSAYAAANLGGNFLIHLGLLIAFLAMLRWVLQPIVDRLVSRFDMDDGQLPPEMLAGMLCLAFGFAVFTYAIGIFAIFGGFAAGLLFHRHRTLVAAWDRQVGRLVLVLFLPVFFTFTGLHTDLLGLSARDLAWLLVVLCAAIFGKIVPVALTARAMGESPRAALTIGTLMNTRALMELIVLDAGRSLGVIPPTMFTMLVLMAVATTMMTGPLLSLLLPRARVLVAA
jgi:Kef-type K+ transport system membrane component KefB